MEDDGQKDLEDLLLAREQAMEKQLAERRKQKKRRQLDEWDTALDAPKVSSSSTLVLMVVMRGGRRSLVCYC